jgi:uncharacterized protein YyaL (SSP411 family)
VTGSAGPNRLAREKSPYLLQHANNPVDWYPWGEEAFDKAVREDKPIFLSIGYSTCHWCHVMERESFERDEIGRLLSDHFVPIKVDREERPDIDQIYMAVCQGMTGAGGWPLTVLLTPDRRPFFAGTYFPPETRFGRPGLKEILYQILGAWDQQRERVIEAAGQIVDAIRPQLLGSPGEPLDLATLHVGFEQIASRFDETYGGFGTAPKFPTPHVLTFLLRWWARSGDAAPLTMVEKTLQAMRRGGVYDQVGFGFHRYSTDAEWLVPHFEKMLYDQALLLTAYVEAYQATGRAFYGAVAREIAAYVLRDLRSPEGAFYSAEDADSEGEEGKFYVWRQDEIEAVLGAEEAAIFCRVHGIEAEGNWRDEASGRPAGTNIPHLEEESEPLAVTLGIAPEELAVRLERAREKLLEARGRRVRPHRDDKILLAWNALMISGLAKAGRALGEPAYLEAAEHALAFLTRTLVREDGRLLARYRDGDAAHLAYLDDYAFLAAALLDLYEGTFDPGHLDAAARLVGDMQRLFWDRDGGGFFFTGEDAEPLIARTKEIYDGAMPSGNSVAAEVLLRLGRITGDESLAGRAEELFRAFSGVVSRIPSAHTRLLGALDFALGPTREIVIAGEPEDGEAASMLRSMGERFLPRTVSLWRRSSDAALLERVAPFTRSQVPAGGKATAYVCENYACGAPFTRAADLARSLDALTPEAGA